LLLFEPSFCLSAVILACLPLARPFEILEAMSTLSGAILEVARSLRPPWMALNFRAISLQAQSETKANASRRIDLDDRDGGGWAM
jgi:hypothetical protein